MPDNGIDGIDGIDKLSGIVVDKVDRVLRGLTLETIKRLVEKTPVDTGRARANWQVDHTKAEPGGIEDTDPSGTGTIAQAAGIVAKLKAKDGIVYITNGLPYIEALEKGHSDQAPQGMVAVTIAELKMLTASILKDIKITKIG